MGSSEREKERKEKEAGSARPLIGKREKREKREKEGGGGVGPPLSRKREREKMTSRPTDQPTN